MPETFSANEVSEMLSVPVTTIKGWSDKLGLGRKASSGKRLFDARDIEALRLTKVLRDEDCGFNTIARRLSTDGDGHYPSPSVTGHHESPESPLLEPKQRVTGRDETSVADLRDLAGTLGQALQQATENAQQLTKVTEEVNRLSLLLAQTGAESERLRGELLQAERRLLEADSASQQRDAAAQKRIVELETALDAEKTKSWWQKLLGR